MDGGILIGHDATRGIGLGVAEALGRLDRLGVRQALAASWRALHFDMREGNRDALAAAEASNGRLVPLAAISLYGHDAGDGYVEGLKGAGFAGIVLFPGRFGWGLDHVAFRALARQAADLGLPMQLVIQDPADLIHAADHAGLPGGPVLLRWTKRGGYTNLPDILAVARDCPNFLFDVGSVTQTGGIDRLAERMGPERLFVAANMPDAYEACPYFMLQASGLDAEAKRLVGGANLARLFGRPEPATPPLPADWLRLRDWPKVDTHWHTSGWNLVEPKTDFDSLRATFDAFSYRVVVNSSIRALNDDLEAGNAETRALMDLDPRVRGLVVINPLEPERSIAQVERYRDDRRFVGVKTIQDFYGLDLDAPGYCAVFDRIRGGDWPVMAHLPGMERAADKYPDLGFVAAHSTWRYEEMARRDNIWFDIATSTSLRHETDLKGLIERVGPGRVLFTSDGQLMNPSWTLGKIACLGLDDEALDTIFRRTAQKAFPRLADDREAIAA